MSKFASKLHSVTHIMAIPPVDSLKCTVVAIVVGLSIIGTTTLGQSITEREAEIGSAGLDSTSADDLLRGFTDEELAAAERRFARRAEPPLGKPIPRRVHVAGRVFQDINQDGKHDAAEPGLSGVLVSDGERVVRTDAQGRFEFTFDMPDELHCRFVTATRPTGKRPTSLPVLRIRFDEPTKRYDAQFGMIDAPHSRQQTFSFITASDSQFSRPDEMIAIAKDFAQITSDTDRLAFLVTAGDLTMTGTHHQWNMYDEIRRASKIDVYDGFGGHDGNCLSPRSTVNYELRVGPTHYSWDYGGVHFIQIVSEFEYLRPKARARHDAWLQADLSAIPPETPVFVVSHYPLEPAWFDQRRADGVRIIGQLAAHWHVVMAGRRDDIPVLIAAPARGRDWGAYSRTYRIIHVSPRGISSELRVAGQYERLELCAPGPTTTVGAQPLVISAYDSVSPLSGVRCAVTSPDGRRTQPPLKDHGDWSWHGEFKPTAAGRWKITLEATTGDGRTLQREYTVAVTKKNLSKPEAASDFPHILAGEPPRCVKRGPGAPLYPLWVRHVGATHVLHSSPVVADGRVYVTATDPNAGSPEAAVVCLRAETGEIVWRKQLSVGDLRTGPSVRGNRVFVTTGESRIVALDAARGDVLWSRTLREIDRRGRPLALNQSPPIPTRHGLLVSDWQRPQFLLDDKTGSTLAELKGDAGYYSSFPTVFDGVMYTASRAGVAAIEIEGNKRLWKQVERARSTSACVVVDGKLLYATGAGITVRDATTGKQLWHASVPGAGNQRPIPVVWDQRVLVNGTDLIALDLATGESIWSVPCGREAGRFLRSQRQALAGSSSPIIAGDLAYFGHDDTSIRAVNREGKVVWEYRVGTPIKTSPTVSGNLLFVYDYAGNLWCFRP